jgi:hypothetical protein
VRIDQDYLKRLLEACQASEKPTFDIEDLKARGVDYGDPKFEFHMKILDDQHFIEQDDGDPGCGLFKSADGLGASLSRFHPSCAADGAGERIVTGRTQIHQPLQARAGEVRHAHVLMRPICLIVNHQLHGPDLRAERCDGRTA